jgi:hypothetical protein
MVIHNLDSPGITVGPLETYPPLIINPNTPVAGAISRQSLQMICGRRTQILERLRPVEHTQLTQRHLLNLSWQSAGPLTIEYLFGFFVFEIPDHASTI